MSQMCTSFGLRVCCYQSEFYQFFTEMKKKMRCLILLSLCLSVAFSDSHSLRYYTTGVSAPGSGLPEFSMVGYVDDQQINLYSSDTGRAVPVTQWMKEKERPEFWEIMTQGIKGEEVIFRQEVKLWIQRFNISEDFHYTQVMTGCELRDDGSTRSYELYSRDGKEFMFYDVQTETFIPTMAEAQTITQRWNRPTAGRTETVKIFLKNICVEELKRYIEYGKEDLERRVRPQVKVRTGRELGEVTKLHCLVYGFHPRAVDVKWMKNEVDDVPSYETTNVLPNPDGTYQIMVTVEVILKESESYSCYVDHSSLEKPLLVKWEPEQDSRLAVIISVVIIVLVLTSGIVGFLVYKKKKDNYTTASTSDPP